MLNAETIVIHSVLTSCERYPALGPKSHQVSKVILFLVGVCLLVAGCKTAVTTWSAEARSPDGQWLANARSQQWSGPGNDYDATTVYLKWIKGSQPPARVLVFSHQYATMNLRMEWITPTHLAVTYGPSVRPGDHVSLDFQVVKISGIDISVRDLSAVSPK